MAILQAQGRALYTKRATRSAVAPSKLSRRVALRVVASAADTEAKTAKAVVPLDDREHFRTILAEAAKANEVLVVDYFTTWCGPCKLVAPLVEEMAVEYKSKGVRVAKVTCDASNENKKWAMDIAIKSLPTFRIYRGGKEEHVGQLVGTKIDQLRKMVDEQLAA